MDLQEVESYQWLKAINRFNTVFSIPVIVVTGIIGNLIALAVFVFTPLRRLTVSVYLTALSITNIAFLVFVGIGWLDTMEFYKLVRADGTCQIMTFMTYVVSFLSIWFIVTITAELYTSIFCTRLHLVISRPKPAAIICLSLVMVACVLYTSCWYSTTVKMPDSKWSCPFVGIPPTTITISISDTFLTLIIPICLLLFMNIGIVHSLASTTKHKYQHGEKISTKSLQTSTSAAYRNGLITSTPAAYRNGLVVTINKERRNRRIPACCDQTIIAKTDQRDLTSDPEQADPKSSCDLNHVTGGRNISLRLSNGEININKANGDTMAVTKLVVQNNTREIPLSNRHRDLNVREKRGEKSRRPQISKSKTLLSTGNSKTHYCAKAYYDKQRQRDDNIKTFPFAKKSSVTPSTGSIVENEENSDVLMNQEEEDGCHTANTENAVVYSRTESPMDTHSNAQCQRRCLKMVISMAIVFLVFNLPCHAIRLQSLIRSLFYPSYSIGELENSLQHLFQTIYYLNFVVNFVTYSVCAKSFHRAFFHLSRHIMSTFSQQCCQACCSRQRHTREFTENSQLMNICISQLHLSQIPSFGPDFKYVSPPCLLRLE